MCRLLRVAPSEGSTEANSERDRVEPTCTCIYTCMYVHGMRENIHVHVHVCTSIHVHVHAHVHGIIVLHESSRVYIHVHVYVVYTLRSKKVRTNKA